MTVSELLELLEGCDPEAEVRIMSQESWPFENAVRGIAVREDFAGDACECDHRSDGPHEDGCPSEDDGTPENCAANDVFIVEGEQERYGDKSAWEVVRRY